MKLPASMVCAAGIALLAGCGAAPSLVTPPAAQTQIALPNVAKIPACKGQKTTKDDASLGAKPLATKGGTLCVPLFDGWGGSLTYPGPTAAGVTMTLTSSTTAYSGEAWPPAPPGTAIFYLRFVMNKSDVSFGKTAPGAGDVAGKGLKAKSQYTIYGDLEATASLWMGLGTCYEAAVDGKYGAYLPNVGKAMFAGRTVFASQGVIEIIPGVVGGAQKC